MVMNRIFNLASVLFLILSFLFISVKSEAATTELNADFFVPAIGQRTFFQAHDSTMLYHFQFSGALLGSYGYRPFQIRQAGSRLQGVIDHLLVQHAMVAFGLFDVLQVGADIPYVYVNYFQSPNIVPGTGTDNTRSFGDMRLEVKARILDPMRFPVGLAVIPFMTIPTGKSSAYVGDASYTGGGLLAFDVALLPRLSLLLNAGYQGGKHVSIRNIDYQHRFLFSAGGKYRVGKNKHVFVESSGWTNLGNLFKDREESPMEILGGMSADLGKSGVTVRAGAGTCTVCGASGARVRALASVGYRLNTEEFQRRDEIAFTTIVTKKERKLTPEVYTLLQQRCPAAPEDFDPKIHDEGCPKYYEFQDVAELYFRCPSPEQFNPKIHDASCEKIFTLSENYSDEDVFNIVNLSTAEMNRRCPSDPSEFDARVHDAGCPKYYDFSKTVLLGEKCPNTLEQYDPQKHDPTCMTYFDLQKKYDDDQWAVLAKLAHEDTDGDGIRDYQDQCPNSSEDKDGFADDDGCPDENQDKEVVVTGAELVTLEPVYFDFDKAILRAQAYNILDHVADFIDQNPWVRHIRVEGHADSIGEKVVNSNISRYRAQVVIDYLKRRLARRDVKFTAVAYGANEPVAPNSSPEDRAKNRRVVFTLVTK